MPSRQFKVWITTIKKCGRNKLELKYGRPERFTDSILSDIRKLNNTPGGDHSSFINSVEIIERFEAFRYGQGDEHSNNDK